MAFGWLLLPGSHKQNYTARSALNPQSVSHGLVNILPRIGSLIGMSTHQVLKSSLINVNLYVAVVGVKRKKKAAAAATTLETSLASICSYFHQRPNDTDEDIFARYLSTEMKKISAENIKQKVKRKLMEVVLDGVDEDLQQEQQLPQYFVLSQDGALQVVNHIPEQ